MYTSTPPGTWCARLMLAARKDVSYLEIEAAQGHDAFLLPIPRYIEALSGYMNRIEVNQ